MTGEGGVVQGHMVRGVAWAFAMRWGGRLIGLVSTMILSRLLLPEDFGVAASATVVLAIVITFSQLGIDTLVLRSDDRSRAFCDTAWTLQLMQMVLVAGALLLVAPLAAAQFDEPRVAPVVRWLALVALCYGLRNVGAALMLREFDFARDFRLNTARKLAIFAGSVGTAFILRDYWALVVGQILGAAVWMVLSYAMHPYRPRLTLERWRQFLPASVSLCAGQIGRFLNEKADLLVVASLFPTAQVGYYNLAGQLSAMATGEVLATLNRPLFPGYAKLLGDAAAFRALYLKSLASIMALYVPIGVGLALVSTEAVTVVYGERWLPAAPLLQWLALAFLAQGAIHFLGTNMLLVPGGERLIAPLYWLRLVLVVPALIVSALAWGVAAVPVAAAVVQISVLPLHALLLARLLPVGAGEMAATVWRPLAAAAVMAGVLSQVDPAGFPVLAALFANVAVGAAAYGVVLMLLWRLAGRPPGIESALWSRLAAPRRTLRAK